MTAPRSPPLFLSFSTSSDCFLILVYLEFLLVLLLGEGCSQSSRNSAPRRTSLYLRLCIPSTKLRKGARWLHE